MLQYVLAGLTALGIAVSWGVSGYLDFAVRIGITIGGGFAVLVLIAFAEVLKVLIDIEENTRRAAKKNANAPAVSSVPSAPPKKGVPNLDQIV